jgi:hypothetical protein
MLVITSEAEDNLALAREFTDRADKYVYNKTNSYPVFRVQLENALEYLRTYGCKVSTQPLDEQGHPCGEQETTTQIDRVKVELIPDYASGHATLNPFGFGVSWYKKTDGVYAHWMSGGLMWHGPVFRVFSKKGLDWAEFHAWAEKNLAADHPASGRNYWGIHT